MTILRLLLGMMLPVLAACGSGAVVFAPTPLPPDQSAIVYLHPSGAFSLAVPRQWPVYEQNLTVAAAAAFSIPQETEPALRIAVVNAGQSVDAAALGAFIEQYQTAIRPDLARYTESNRQAMGDGSWRMTGLRQTVTDATEQVNTFIQSSGTAIAVIEVVLPDDPARRADLEQVVNTFSILPENSLEMAEPDVLASLSGVSLEFLHVSHWVTPGGVFFITGEVNNTGLEPVSSVPVRAVLYSTEGLPVAEAVDTVMGYSLPPGGYAPFSLRFGQGQPALTSTYELSLGGVDWTPQTNAVVYGADELSWSDESTLSADGSLSIEGTVQNISPKPISAPRAVATIFDASGRVIAAGFTDIAAVLAPDERASYRILITEMGGEPANYLVAIQGLP
ncbi:MAG: hypothetical protein JNM70_13920 [Anaerolineae bacterium]|nr:hypothetical protein [Anaerolineae bacterium]